MGAEAVEDDVVAQVLSLLDRPEMAARLASHPDPERARLLAEVASAEEDMTEAVTLRGQGIYTAQQRDQQFYPAKQRADRARAALAALPDPDVDLPPADQVRERWESGKLTLRQQRTLLQRYIESVQVKPAERRGRSKLTTEERIAERVDVKWRA
jgi:hypothetical protein